MLAFVTLHARQDSRESVQFAGDKLPTGWVECGMGAAKDSQTCASTNFDEITSVGNLAINLFTFAAGKTAKIVKESADGAKLKKLFENMKILVAKSEKVQNIINKGQRKFPLVDAGKSITDILKADPAPVAPEDMVRVSAQIAALADPSGISDVVSAYNYPKCTKIEV